jgi:hypothetical protein
MKHIRLDDYHEYVVSDAVYPQIVALVEANLVCRTCEKAYTQDRPQVVLNTCVACFLRREQHQHLTYVGVLDTAYGIHHKFVDPNGYIYVSYISSEKADRSNYYTIKHYGFPVPTSYNRDGNDHRLDPYYWYIHGDFKTNAVIVIDYHESYGDHLHVAFIVSKDESMVEINRRKGDIQKLFKRARAKAEASKDAKGAYHLHDDITTYQLYDSHLYAIISEMLSSEYNQQKQETLL